MKKLKFTFLTCKQVFGKYYLYNLHKDFFPKHIKGRLSIFNKIGVRAEMTDYSTLLGGIEGWWTQTTKGEYAGRVVTATFNRIDSSDATETYQGARPSISYKSIASKVKNKVKVEDGILEVEYGEYPQTVVSDDLSKELESAFSNQTMNETGKRYTYYTQTPKNEYQSYLRLTSFTEYEYNGKKYIRFVGGTLGEGRSLTDGRTIQKGSIYWIAVEPIKWVVDEKANIAISKNIIFSGIPFDYRGKKFKSSLIKEYMDNYFSKEIIPSHSSEIVLETNQEAINSTNEQSPKRK